MSAFLTAEWKRLLMVNYEVPAELLLPHLPAGTELDQYEGKYYVSLVGFLFDRTRVKGVAIPFHRCFPEVNLRFYVKQQTEAGSRRGVVFIKEIVPRPAISWVANTLYHEHYETHPMHWKHTDELVSYAWYANQRWHQLEARIKPEPTTSLMPGSLNEFIAEHYWGYTRFSLDKTLTYEVQHIPWQLLPIVEPYLDVDFSQYGEAFAFLNIRQPASVFCAEGSAIAVLPKQTIKC